MGYKRRKYAADGNNQVFERFRKSNNYKDYGIRWLLPEARETLGKKIK